MISFVSFPSETIYGGALTWYGISLAKVEFSFAALPIFNPQSMTVNNLEYFINGRFV
jgi:hypothetical protein